MTPVAPDRTQFMLCLLLPNPPSDLKPPVQARELTWYNRHYDCWPHRRRRRRPYLQAAN